MVRWLISLLLLGSSVCRAGVIEVFPGDDLRASMSNLVAGDELVIHAGSYSTQSSSGSWFLQVAWNGTAAQPIVVRGASGALPLIQGDATQNILNIDGSYFELSNLELTGGSHGLRLGNVDHATLSDLVIHDIEDVGISCNRPTNLCDALTVRHNEIYNTGISGNGEGMYIGCNNAGCVVSNSLFEGNYVHDLGGNQGDGIEIKTGSFGNTLRDNVIIGAKFPGITMYGFADQPGRTRNLVERNFVWNTIDNGIQIVGQVVVRNNIVVASGNSGIQAKPSQGFLPHDFEIVHNTVYQVGGDACLKGNNWGTANINAVIANNALYCPGGNALRVLGGNGLAIAAGNVGEGAASGLTAGFLSGNSAVQDFGDPATLDFWPSATSALLASGDPTYRAADDFNKLARMAATVDAGAYEHLAAANPGWLPKAGFKSFPGPIFADGFESP